MNLHISSGVYFQFVIKTSLAIFGLSLVLFW